MTLAKPDRASAAPPVPISTTAAARRRNVLLAAALIAVTIIVYAPAFQARYVWDDNDYVTHNLTLRSLAGLRAIWFEPAVSPQYYPLVFTSFWVEYHLWGLAPRGYHATNVGLHLVNCLLLIALLRRLQVPGAVWAGFLFALHPVHVESVAWISERKDLLSTLFALLTVRAWLAFITAGRRRAYAAVVACFAASMLSKTAVCPLPIALAIIGWWQYPKRWRPHLAALMPLLAIAAALGGITVWREHSGDGFEVPVAPLTPIERWLLAGRAFWFYLGKLVWPDPLATFYPRWQLDPSSLGQHCFPLAAIALLAILWGYRNRIGRGPFAALAFFAVMLAPGLGLIDFNLLKRTYVADHLQYLASAGPIALAAAVVVFPGQRSVRLVLTAGLAVALVMFALTSTKQTKYYEDEVTLWRHTIDITPDSWVAHYNLGSVLSNRLDLDGGLAHLWRAVELEPRSWRAHNNLGTVLQRAGQVPAAIEQYQKALELRPDYPNATLNLRSAMGDEPSPDRPPPTAAAPTPGFQPTFAN